MAAFWESKWWGWVVKVGWVALHAFGVGILLFLDSDLRRETLDGGPYWIAACYYALLTLTVAQFFRLVGSSPGYIREAIDEDGTFEVRAQTALNSTLTRPTPRSRPEKVPLLPEANEELDTCKDCGTIQPFRTRHCRICNECVLRFDHHCVWLGTCLGLKNHRKFWWFLFLETLLLSWTAVEYVLAMKSIGTEKNQTSLVIVLVIVLVLVVCVLYVASLLGYHTHLVVTNQTTYEKLRRKDIHYLRNLPDGRRHPFSRGCAGNVQSFCCTSTEAYPVYNLPTPEEMEAARDRRCCI